MTIAPRLNLALLALLSLVAASPAVADGYEHVQRHVHRHHAVRHGWPYGWVYGWPGYGVYGWAGYPPAVLCYRPESRALVADRLNWVVSRHRPAFCSMLQSNQGLGEIVAAQYMRHGTAG
ncbi:MAG TPA: hypothetical protein VLX44_18000 [Xanthobacteraceae bacterium]|nr:hypothetical protein [Xanthobacteraceae bacterium]